MNFIETFLGMPWPQYVELWKASVELLFTQYLIVTITLYIIFIVILSFSDAINSMANLTLVFLLVLLLFANPLARLFKNIYAMLHSSGINIYQYFT